MNGARYTVFATQNTASPSIAKVDLWKIHAWLQRRNTLAGSRTTADTFNSKSCNWTVTSYPREKLYPEGRIQNG
jgi:hypothetical protein